MPLYNFYGRPRTSLHLPPNAQVVGDVVILDDAPSAQAEINGDLTAADMVAFMAFPADMSDSDRAQLIETGELAAPPEPADEDDVVIPAPEPPQPAASGRRHR